MRKCSITLFGFMLRTGRYNLSMPVLSCISCCLTWSPSIKDIQRDGYWPGSGTTNFCTLYATDIFQSFYDLKIAAPGVSLKAFLRMLDARTVRFGRVSVHFTKCNLVPCIQLINIYVELQHELHKYYIPVILFVLRLVRYHQTHFTKASQNG